MSNFYTLQKTLQLTEVQCLIQCHPTNQCSGVGLSLLGLIFHPLYLQHGSFTMKLVSACDGSKPKLGGDRIDHPGKA